MMTTALNSLKMAGDLANCTRVTYFTLLLGLLLLIFTLLTWSIAVLRVTYLEREKNLLTTSK